MARTAVAPVPATREQLLTAVAVLPMATPSGDTADYVTMPVERIEVGAIVCAHAQAKVRGVVVTKVGPKRATIEWTTPSTMAQDEELVRIFTERVNAAGGPEAYVAKAVKAAEERLAGSSASAERCAEIVASQRQQSEREVGWVTEAARLGYVAPRTYSKTVPLADIYAPISSALTAG